jgi:signal transduction histidine kinase/DNA-binding response OmpR family regulator/ligand-binding sensor domain-containing protein
LKKRIWCLLLIAITGKLYGQTAVSYSRGFYIEKYTAEDGLPGNSVADIAQDQQGYLWLATHGGLVRYDGYEFKIYYPFAPSERKHAFDNFIYCLHPTSDGKIWAGSLSNGVYIFNPEREQFEKHLHRDSSDYNSLSYDWISNIEEVPAGTIWVASHHHLNQITKAYDFTHFIHRDSISSSPNQRSELSQNGGYTFVSKHDSVLYHLGQLGLDRLRRDNTFEPVVIEINNHPSSILKSVDCIADKRDGRLWVAGKTDGQESAVLGIYDPRSNKYQLLDTELPGDVNLNHLYEDTWGRLWIATWGSGLYVIDFSQSSEAISITLNESGKASTENIWDLFPDRYGNLWVGTWGSHLYKIRLSGSFSDIYKMEGIQGNRYAPAHIAQSPDGRLWASTLDNQVFAIPKDGKKPFRLDLPLGKEGSNQRHASPVHYSNDTLWIGTYNGLLAYLPSTKTTFFFPIETTNKNLEGDWINTLSYSPSSIWCGTQFGCIYRFDLSTKSYEAFHEERSNLGIIGDIEVLSNGHIVAGSSRGIHYLDPDNKSKKFYQQFAGALDLHQDHQQNIWVSTYLSGIYKLTPGMELDTNYLLDNSINLSWINGIVGDHEGKLWFSSPEGIIQYSAITDRFKTFSALQQIEMSKSGGVIGKYLTQDGTILFSGKDKIYGFKPHQFADNPIAPDMVIQSVVINGETVPTQTAYQLAHHQNDLLINYTGIHLESPQYIRYKYKMDPLDDHWVEAGPERIARYANLRPGRYRFQVMAANSDGVWQETPLDISFYIASPWWTRWWAYTIYFVLLSTGIYLLYRFQLNRRLAQEEAERLRALDTLKSRMYTNITHEFRTPLTVIQGMSEQARRYFQQSAISEFDQAIRSVQRNARQLLKLINQMLDLSRLEAGQLQLKLIQDDVISYLQYIVESFHSYAESKQVQLLFESNTDELILDFDPDKLMHIASNLLSNAIKFSPEGGQVCFLVAVPDDHTLLLKVRDNGIGIPPEHQAHIFDRFYQVDDSSTRSGEGTGIGLSLTKELVELMKGSIHLESEPGQGSTFMVQLPISQKANANTAPYPSPIDSIPYEMESTTATNYEQPEDQPTILVVEDNADVRHYIQACLQSRYQIITATDGAAGIQMALDNTPDLIISDVMMPVKDGFELCRTLKRNERTSHIPIVLLTAKADEAAKIEGLEGGADAYLSKPFNQKELFVRLRKLIELRKRLQAYYQHASPIHASSPSTFPQEDAFIRKIQALLEEHLDDESYNVQMLAREMNMSRSQVFRKLKALTGKSIVQYMREYRLHIARQLLQQGELTISEVAYEVGFKDPAYFSRAYSALFGAPPSTTRK